jgi:hypothetical protein
MWVRHEGVWGSGCIDPHFLDLGTGWRGMVNFTSRPLYPPPRGKAPPPYSLDRMLGGPRSWSGRHEDEKILDPTGTRTQPLGPAAHSQSLYRLSYPGSTKCCILFYCYYLPSWVVQTAVLKNAFYRVGHGALWMNLWNQGAVARKRLGTTYAIQCPHYQHPHETINIWIFRIHFCWCPHILLCTVFLLDRLRGLAVRVPGYRSRGPGFDSWLHQIFWEVMGLERGPLNLVRITEELLEQKSSGSGLENRRLTAVGIRCADHVTPSTLKSWH